VAKVVSGLIQKGAFLKTILKLRVSKIGTYFEKLIHIKYVPILRHDKPFIYFTTVFFPRV
jgi:hypothetical protein